MKTLKYKRIIIGILIITLVAILGIVPMELEAADGTLIWRKLDTMDTNFTIINNKTGDNEILLELDLSVTGNYALFYHLEDGRQTEIRFQQAYEKVDVKYFVREDLGATNVTQDLVSNSYLQMDYNLTVPDWRFDGAKLVGPSGGLEFSIPRSASSQYPGVAFEVDNKRVYIKWDFQLGKAFVLIRNYNKGFIMPVSYAKPNGTTENIKVLKGLEGFTVTPTHLRENEAGTANIEIKPIAQPTDTGNKPGNRPGLDIKFKQPKELDNDTWTYDYELTNLSDISAIIELDDIGSDSYLDFNFRLKDFGDLDDSNLVYALDVDDADANVDVGYDYDSDTHEYKVRLVKDNSDLFDDGKTIQWSELEASRIYNVNIGFQVDLDAIGFEDYGFTGYRPVNGFGYTYMAYELKRANAKEAYLDIVPYDIGSQGDVEYIILYSKVVKPELDPNGDLWLKNYHSTTGDNDEIFIPVPFQSTSSQDAYQVFVNFAGVQIRSQVLNYKAIDDQNVPPTTPAIRTIENVIVVPPLDETDNPTKVEMDLVWDAPTNKTVKELDDIFKDGGSLFYELSINEVPTNNASNPYQVIKVFEVYKEDNVYKLRQSSDVPGTLPTPSEQLNYAFGYNKTDERLRLNKIVLYENGAWINTLDTVIDEEAVEPYVVSDSQTPYDFEFPGVNYLRIKAITVKDGVVSESQMSIPASLSLSMVTYDIPIVDTLTYDPLYGNVQDRSTGVTLKWHTVDVANYERNMLEPINKAIESINYKIYISEALDQVLPLNEDDSEYELLDITNEGLMLIGDDAINELRDGEVVYFVRSTPNGTNTNLSVDVQGLDANKTYYIRIVTQLEITDDEIRESDPSSVLSATVPQTPIPPGDEEIFPLAPEGFTVDYADEGLLNAGLTWFLPAAMAFEDDLNGFEVLAIEDRALPENLSAKTIGITDILDGSELSSDVVEGWRIYKHEGITYLKKYNRQTGLWEDKDLALLVIENNRFYLIDDANAPNKVNYYYVRSTKMEGEFVTNTSPWVPGTLTTAPVKGPINLIVDYESGYTYESKTALIIRFDAPIPEMNQIGSDYRIEVFVKGEDDLDYTITKYPAVLLGDTTGGPVGYKRLHYRITDLKPGKTYNIKVRIEDRTKPEEILPDGSRVYPKSPYSETVVSRTEFDQESYDKENKYYEYIDYYLRKAEALKQLIYFKITDTSRETAVKYRENYGEGIIKRTINGELTLYSDNKATNTYYVPSNSLEAINGHNVTIKIQSKNQVVGIRPRTLGVNISKEVGEMVEEIKRYNSTYKDYYLRIKIHTDTFTGKINNITPSSEVVQVELALVGSFQLEEEIDRLMVSTLDSVIASNRAGLIVDIENELKKGINDTQLIGIVDQRVKKVEQAYISQASNLYFNNISSNVTTISQPSKAIYIALAPIKSPANNEIYTRENNVWKKVNSTYFNNRHYVDALKLNPYILLPSSNTSVDLVQLYAQDGIDVINYYNLSSIFTANDFQSPTKAIQKYQWVSALARLIGAPEGQDTADYLRNRGINATTLNSYQTLRKDQALGLYIDTYAYRHKINLNRVVITNYNIISDIGEADAALRQKLIIGANLGIIKPEGGRISPSQNITMKEAMQLLITLHKGLN
ncbi:hypothetical protein [Petrocella sp. FN5]|uniref:hypothetical protein n=1 Tax=Petrocella sp. FN5 TaxID=3032002 RepID=UPI0023DBC13A|nr:hypothetical protein [Petrocella sp. FN5]MDF1617125.1 hypothetical protein [Petrocella sp. FN5]